MAKKGKGRVKKKNLAGKSNSEEDDSLVCALCAKSFLQTDDFELHINQAHPFSCQCCQPQLFFISQGDLEKHAGHVHPEASEMSRQLGQSDQGEEGLGRDDEVGDTGGISGEGGQGEDATDSSVTRRFSQELKEDDGEENTPPEIGADTICAECAPVVRRMLANIPRRVFQRLQEEIVKSSGE